MSTRRPSVHSVAAVVLSRAKLAVKASSARTRYILLVLASLLLLHTTLTYAHDDYSRHVSSSLSSLSSSLSSAFAVPPLADDVPEYYFAKAPSPAFVRPPRANGTLVMLARNGDVEGAVRSVRRLEDRWNRRYMYPWVFLNDEPFDDNFKRRVSILTNADVSFGTIPRDHWVQPAWINETKAAEERKRMAGFGFVPYAESVSYRNMCRFNSGFFYRHELLAPYKWYWRVEPDVDFTCDIHFDPIAYMEENNKTYAFTIALTEFVETVPTLWDTTKAFFEQHPEHLARNNALAFVSGDDGAGYNMCHFWSNFEIASLDFFRGQAYADFFEHLDRAGGFYYERWGDAPVHSIAAALMLNRRQIHFFDPIGYEHPPFNHCPQKDVWRAGRCSCGEEDTFDYVQDPCKWRYDALAWMPGWQDPDGQRLEDGGIDVGAEAPTAGGGAADAPAGDDEAPKAGGGAPEAPKAGGGAPEAPKAGGGVPDAPAGDDTAPGSADGQGAGAEPPAGVDVVKAQELDEDDRR